MRGAVRPFLPGPLVIVDNTIRERVVVCHFPLIERGPLTEDEKRQFLPPKKSARVRAEQDSARDRAARYADHAPTKRKGAYTPPRGWKARSAPRTAPASYTEPPVVDRTPPFRRALTRAGNAVGQVQRMFRRKV